MTIGGFSGGYPSQSSGIGKRILSWFGDVLAWWITTPIGKFQAGIVTALFGGLINSPERVAAQLISNLVLIPSPAAQIMVTVLTALSGVETKYLRPDWKEIVGQMVSDPRKYMQGVAAAVAQHPPQDFYAEKLGEVVLSVIYYPVTRLLDSESGDPEQTLKQVVGQTAAFALAIHTIGLVAEVLGIGQIQSVAMALSKMVDSVDLQGWIHGMTQPVLSRAYYEFGRRYYNKRYRPQRWTISELLQLYGLRAITRSHLVNAMAEEGYPDRDIETAISLAEKRPSAGDVLSALDLGMIDMSEAVDRLHGAGYGEDAISFSLRLQQAKSKDNDLSAISSVALTAYKKHLISESEFRTMRSGGGVPPERIDLEVRMVALQDETERRELSAGNIKAAYKAQVIARQEADHFLETIGVDVTARQLMLDTWDEELKPKVLRLNSSTILSAYKDGVLSEQETRERLKEIGWTTRDIDLMLSVAKAELVSYPRTLSDWVILSAYENGIISYDGALSKLVQAGYTAEDAKTYMQLSTIQPTTNPKSLTKSEIIKLFDTGYIDYGAAVNMLVGIGYDEQTAQLVILAGSKSAGAD